MQLVFVKHFLLLILNIIQIVTLNDINLKKKIPDIPVQKISWYSTYMIYIPYHFSYYIAVRIMLGFAV